MAGLIDKRTVFVSLFWKFLERSGTRAAQLLVQIALARLLLPDDFGTVAIVMVFISLAQVFVQRGFSTALIQAQRVDNLDFSSVFYFNLMLASALYMIIYFVSPFVAEFYGDASLITVLRVLALVLFAGALNSVQNAYISRNMLFRKLFTSSIVALFVSGVSGIVAAYAGFGVWALVIEQMVSQIGLATVMWFTVRWRPCRNVSIKRLKVLFSFGWKLLVSSLLGVLYTDIRTLIIGRVYAPSVLGQYNRGQQIPQAIVTAFDGSIQSVMLPTLASHQDDRKRVKEMMRRAIVSSSFLIFPMMIGMAVVAEPLVKVVLTDKWLPAVPFLQIFCLSYALMPIHTANLQAINALGRSDIFLRLEVIKKAIGLIVLAISLPFGVYAIAIGQVISGIISTFVNARPNKRLLDYSYLEQWKDLSPSLLIAAGMGFIVYLSSFVGLEAWQQLVVQVAVGVTVYIGLAKIFRIEAFAYLTATVSEILQQRRGSRA